MEKINDNALIELFKMDYIVGKKTVSNSTVTGNSETSSSSTDKKTVKAVVITDQPLSPDQQNLLLNILKAVKLDVNSTPVLQDKNIETLQAEFNIGNILSFGVSGYDLGIKSVQIDLYAPNTYNDINILAADSVGTIASSPEKKQALWLNLKRIFNV